MSMRFWRCCLYIIKEWKANFDGKLGDGFKIQFMFFLFTLKLGEDDETLYTTMFRILGQPVRNKTLKTSSLDLEGFNDLHELRARGHKPCHFFLWVTTMGTQNHEIWRFYTPNIWVITPKNEGFGFPWHPVFRKKQPPPRLACNLRATYPISFFFVER